MSLAGLRRCFLRAFPLSLDGGGGGSTERETVSHAKTKTAAVIPFSSSPPKVPFTFLPSLHPPPPQFVTEREKTSSLANRTKKIGRIFLLLIQGQGGVVRGSLYCTRQEKKIRPVIRINLEKGVGAVPRRRRCRIRREKGIYKPGPLLRQTIAGCIAP